MTKPSVIKWHGGKSYLAPWIIEHFPEHIHYVEPFFGGGAVLFAKPVEWVEGHGEVVNDLNRELINFWGVLQDRLAFERMARILQATPFSQDEFDSAVTASKQREELFDGRIPGGVDRAARAVDFFIRCRQSMSGRFDSFAPLTRNRTRGGMNEQASAWLSAIDKLPEVHARLKRVVILNSDALDVIRQQDGPNTLFYLDPPYLHETRTTTGEYQHEMTVEQHGELLKLLGTIKGKFLLSGYPSGLYEMAAEHHGWHFASREIDNKSGKGESKQSREECLWWNY